MNQRMKRLNSLLKEVISEVIRHDVKNPKVSSLSTVTYVDISPDLHHAVVYISVIENGTKREETIQALQSAADFISVIASKKVRLRYFPSLRFKLDLSVDKLVEIDTLIKQIHQEKKRCSNDSI